MIKKEKTIAQLNKFIEINISLALFCLPFSKTIIEICVTLAITAFFIKKMMGEKVLTVKIDRKIIIALSFFIFFNLLSIINSRYLPQSIIAFFSKALEWAMLFIIVVDTIKTERQLKKIFLVMLFSCMLILIDAFFQQYIYGIDLLHYPEGYHVFKFHDRWAGATTFPTASFPYPNDFAAWIIIFLFPFLTLTIFDLKKKSFYRILTSSFSMFLLFFLFLTSSRSAILGAFISSIISLIIKGKKILVHLVIFFVIVLFVVSFIPYFKTYFKEGILDMRLSVDDRSNMWSTGWQIFRKHPIVGNGINTFFENFKNFRNDEDKYIRGSYAHNCFLQMGADIGILGLSSFLIFVFLVIYSSIKKLLNGPSAFQNSFILGLSLGLIAFLVHSFFDTNLYSLNLSALFWLGMGLVAAKLPDDKNR